MLIGDSMTCHWPNANALTQASHFMALANSAACSSFIALSSWMALQPDAIFNLAIFNRNALMRLLWCFMTKHLMRSRPLSSFIRIRRLVATDAGTVGLGAIVPRFTVWL